MTPRILAALRTLGLVLVALLAGMGGSHLHQAAAPRTAASFGPGTPTFTSDALTPYKISQAAAALSVGRVLDLDARTVRGFTDGQAIAQAYDSQGVSLTQSTSAQRPVFRATAFADGGPCFSFDRTADQHLRIDAIGSIAANAHTVAAWFTTPGFAGNGNILGFGKAANSNTLEQNDLTTNAAEDITVAEPGCVFQKANTYCRSADAGASVDASGSTAPQIGPGSSSRHRLVVWVHNGASSFVYVNGTKVAYPDLTIVGYGPFDVAAVGSIPPPIGAANSFTGSLRYVGAWSRAFTDLDVLNLHTALGFPLSSPLPNLYTLWADCDSLTNGNFPYLNQLALPRSFANNTAVSGRTVQTAVANFNANITAMRVTQLPIVYSAWGITNDIYFNTYASANQTAAIADNTAAYFAWLDMAKASGIKAVIAWTPLQRTNWAGGGQWTQPQGYAIAAGVAANIRAGWHAHADYLVDVQADPRLDPTITPGNFNADGTHPLFVGATIIAAIAQPAMSAAMP